MIECLAEDLGASQDTPGNQTPPPGLRRGRIRVHMVRTAKRGQGSSGPQKLERPQMNFLVNHEERRKRTPGFV